MAVEKLRCLTLGLRLYIALASSSVRAVIITARGISMWSMALESNGRHLSKSNDILPGVQELVTVFSNRGDEVLFAFGEKPALRAFKYLQRLGRCDLFWFARCAFRGLCSPFFVVNSWHDNVVLVRRKMGDDIVIVAKINGPRHSYKFKYYVGFCLDCYRTVEAEKY